MAYASRDLLKQQAYDYIRSCIQDDTLKMGERVTELSVCDELGISRTPVREALIQLEADGYLERLPHKGFRVRAFDDQSAREVFEMLGPLDGRAASLALPHLTEDDLAEMRFYYETMELAVLGGLNEQYYETQLKFHNQYIDRCGNARLIRCLRELYGLLSFRSYTRDDPQALDNMKRANEEHAEIIRLFEAKDAERLQDYIRDVHWSLDNVQFASWT
jgi:DNA-binding GntR family transcriptional regulator